MRASLPAVLTVTFLGSIGSGTFWAGLFFVSAQVYRFGPVANLTLAAAMGGVYAAAARGAGRLAHARAPRQVLSAALAIWTLTALLPLLLPGSVAALWVAALIGSAASATTFPVVESYLTAGRHGAEMRSAIGQFNLTWTPATALPLVLLPLLASRPAASFAVASAATAAAWVAMWRLPAHPAPHGAAESAHAIGPAYRRLLAVASWLLPVSYVVSSALAPILPHRLAAVGVGERASLIATLWMATRFAALLAMWRSSFWHGRWTTLAAGAAALGAGLVLVLGSSTLPPLLAGLLLYGAGMGTIYYASLYYTMAVGQAAVDAGGTFEALIGVGYLIGPLLGLAGHLLGR